MALSSESTYNDLNAAECKEILIRRFAALLDSVPGLTSNICLTRVQMELIVTLDIWGATPPVKTITDKTVLKTPPDAPPLVGNSFQASQTLSAVIDSRENPPDLIREEHGLPVMEPTRDRVTGAHSDVPVIRKDAEKFPKPQIDYNAPNPTFKQEGKRKWASFVEQDYGSMQRGERTGAEGPAVGGERITGREHAGDGGDFGFKRVLNEDGSPRQDS